MILMIRKVPRRRQICFEIRRECRIGLNLDTIFPVSFPTLVKISYFKEASNLRFGPFQGGSEIVNFMKFLKARKFHIGEFPL